MSGHASNLIAQLREGAEDEELEDEVRERMRERADELEEQAESSV